MTHTNNDLLNIKSSKNDYSSEHYLLIDSIERMNKVNWKKDGNPPLTSNEKKFKKELDKKFENEVVFHFTC
jgi:hypothetical protein